VTQPQVEVRRSRRRRRTVSAYRDGDRVIVMIPATMSRAEEAEWITRMVARLDRRAKRVKRSDEDLLRRAHQLSRELFDGRAVAGSVAWVTNQNTRWGSCTPGDGSIRLSHRLRSMPTWVQDYVLVHELAHLLLALVPGSQRHLDVLEHRVERRADLTDLGPLVGEVLGHPLLEGRIQCRYEPTCSEYSIQAVRRFGIRRGLEMTFRRVQSCKIDVPLGTYDPVPERRE